MNFEQFVVAVKEEVKHIVGDEYKVSVNSVLKTNRELKSISIIHHNATNAPTVYLEDYYQEYQKGEDIKQIAKEIIALLNKSKLNIKDLMENIKDYEWIKPRLRVKLINYEKNIKLLQSVPYENMLDLAVVPYILISKGEDIMSMTVNNQLVESWGVSCKQVLELAKENTLIIEPVVVEKMTDFIVHMILKELNNMEQESVDERNKLINEIISKDTNRYEMYILTNHDNRNGAFAAFHTKNLSDLADRIGVDKLYLLPSSIHECIAVSADNINSDKLREMVISVNNTEVSENEFLSNTLYLYNKIGNQIKNV